MSKSKPTCSICCENINKSARKEIECMYCEFKSCRTCCESYLLMESVAKCMNTECGKEWTRKFLRLSFPATFINDKLKKHRENIIFERERALMPATQQYAEVRKHNNDILKEYNKIEKELREMKKEMIKMRERKFELHRNLTRVPNNNRDTTTTDTGERERRQFIKPCPVDDCRGFLSTQWKCGLCSIWCCPDCHMIIGATKDTDHTCDPNNVESAKLLKAETKPCPKCAAAIYKIDGCDQMWCTMCHTAFSWRTGQIETNIHNPHYYEWLRKTQGAVPRNPLDQCNQNLNFGRNMIWEFERAFRNCRNARSIDEETEKYYHDKINLIIRFMNHLEIVEIREFNYEAKNRDLRIKYLINEITEDQLKTQLQQAEKKHNKSVEVNDVYRMVHTAVGDILNRFLIYLNSDGSCKVSIEIFEELYRLKEYANECLTDIKRTYGSTSMRLFGDNFALN